MTNYYTRKTPDYSPLVVHFTKDRPIIQSALIGNTHPLFQYRNSTAKARLLSILQSRIIYASPMPFLPNNPDAVCFTECVWKALVGYVERYSPYGVVFSKLLIFTSGGGPALYIRGDNLKTIGTNIPSDIEPFIAPFDPDSELQPGVRLDWVHEREWRLPSSLEFEYSDIQYVIVGSIQDATDVIQQIGAQHIPMEKYITMDVYNTIDKTWT